MADFRVIYKAAMDKLAAGEKNNEILDFITNESDKIIGDENAVSILVLDEEGLLRNASSPRLPADYLRAIDGIRPSPNLGTCAAAAATGEMIFTPDFRADEKWAELKHLPLAIGYSGAWSLPIKNEQDKVVGTFGTYFKTVRLPAPEELAGVKLLAGVLGKLLSV